LLYFIFGIGILKQFSKGKKDWQGIKVVKDRVKGGTGWNDEGWDDMVWCESAFYCCDKIPEIT
jgi:hypothetical protein